MAFTAIMDQVMLEIIIFYIAAIFWTLGYDTIYGVQDIADDEIIGLKSTAIKFKKNLKLFVFTCYLTTTLLVIYLFNKRIGLNLSTVFIIMFVLSLIYQVKIFTKNNHLNCLKAFKLNNYSGVFMFAAILLI